MEFCFQRPFDYNWSLTKLLILKCIQICFILWRTSRKKQYSLVLKVISKRVKTKRKNQNFLQQILLYFHTLCKVSQSHWVLRALRHSIFAIAQLCEHFPFPICRISLWHPSEANTQFPPSHAPLHRDTGRGRGRERIS